MYYVPSDYDSMYYPTDRYEMLRRRHAYEQAQRAAYEKQRQQEMMRRRLYQQELARRRQEQEEEEYRQRLAYEKELSRRAQVQKERKSKNSSGDKNDEYVVVRGPGGYLYRVRRSDLERPTSTSRNERPSNQDSSTEKTEKKTNLEGDTTRNLQYEKETTLDSRLSENNPRRATEFPTSKTYKQPKSKTKITIIVEDASDSEDEGDEMNSMWRNRHPSPGESWMEPIGNTI